MRRSSSSISPALPRSANARSGCHARTAEGFSCAGRQGSDAVRRRDHQLPRRRRHDPVRPAAGAAPDDAARAAQCSIALCVRAERWIAALPPSIASRIGFKIGAHFGPIVASRLGGNHQHITATGDTVNVASRLMEVAAHHDVTARAERHAARSRRSDFGARLKTGSLTGPVETQIRGRSGSLTVWFWRGEQCHESTTNTSRRRGLTGAAYRSSGGGERSSTSPLAPSSRSSA